MMTFPEPLYDSYQNPLKVDPYTSISGGANFLFAMPAFFKSFKFGVGIGYDQYNINMEKSWTSSHNYPGNTDTTQYHEIITGKNSTLFTNLYVMWVMNPLSRTQVFIKAGMSYHFSLTNDPNITSSYSQDVKGSHFGTPFENYFQTETILVLIKSDYLSFFSAAGVSYGRHSFEISYRPPSELVIRSHESSSGNSAVSQISFKVGSISAHYFFALAGTKK